MNREDIFSRFQALQADFPVEKWTFEGLHVWPLVRAQLAFRIHQSYFSGTTVTPATLSDLGILHNFQKRYQDWKQNRLFENELKTPVDIFMLGFSVTRDLFQGKWYNRIFDPLIDAFLDNGSRVLYDELSNGIASHGSTYSKGRTFFGDSHLNRNVWTDRVNHSGKLQAEDLSAFLIKLEEFFPSINIESFSQDSLNRKFNIFYRQFQYFQQLLKKLQPAVVLEICFYDMQVASLVAACRVNGIPVIDIQHGVQGPTHFAYGDFGRIPEQGYLTLPDLFWCWTPKATNDLNMWMERTKIHKAFYGGNPWVEYWLKGTDPKAVAVFNQIKHLKGENSRLLLYSAQPLEGNTFPKEVIDALNKIEPDWTIFIRLHPRQRDQMGYWTGYLKDRLPGRKLVIKEATEMPLPAILTHTNINVTQWSSVVEEAEMLGIQTILTNEKGKLLFKDQLASGVAVLAESSDEIVKAIEKSGKTTNVRQEPKTMVIPNELFQILDSRTK